MWKLYTGTANYSATGEGLTIIGFIAYAENEEDFLRKYTEQTGDDYYVRCMKVVEGFDSKCLTIKYLFSEKILKNFEKSIGRAGNLALTAKAYINFS
jgi:hypothetical protein